MSTHSIKIFVIVGAALLTGLLLAFVYQPNEETSRLEDAVKPIPGQPKNGEIDNYDSFGNLKTRVNYQNGLKHGTSYIYYANGQVQLSLPYVFGMRQGVSKKYYENGALYSTTSYEEDLLHGGRKTYYRNGQPKAVIPYFRGLTGLGLKEYTVSGKEKDLSESFDYQRKGDVLELTAPIACKKEVSFFISELVDQKWLNEEESNLIRIGVSGKQAAIDLNKFNPSYLRYRDIICSCKTSLGNTLVTAERINLTK